MVARARRLAALLVLAGVAALGCAGVEMLGAALAYREAPLPQDRAILDLPYHDDGDDAGAHADKHRLDVFLPPADAPAAGRAGWPVFVFVHGGGWTHGDRAMGGLGIEPIRNLARFHAARGYVTVVPSYRLQPDVGWRDQVADVASAVAWTREEISGYGGDPDRVHLGGHSAGAWLAAWVGLDGRALAALGHDRDFLCSLVLVSGAAYDLADERTWELGASRDYFEQLFGRDGDDWVREASILSHLEPPLPPALLLTAGGEPARFQHQSDLLFAALARASAGSSRVTVPGQNHQRILVSLSREGDPASEATLAFLARNACAGTR